MEHLVQNWNVRKPLARSRGGIVATQNRIAGEAGVSILNAGGNAVDAAVAIGFAMGLGVPRWLLSFLKKRREKKFLNDFPDGVDVIVRGIKAGLPLLDSLKIIATEAQEPIRSEFKSIVETHGKLDILVSNAGITRDQLMLRMKRSDWDEVLATNLTASFTLCQAALKPMIRARGGRIIAISSVVGQSGNAGQANYSASKAGLVGLTRTVAKELAGRKVTVNAVAPGFIASDMTAALGPLLMDEVKKRVPAKRLGEAWEIADAVLFLAAPSSGYLTAQVVTVSIPVGAVPVVLGSVYGWLVRHEGERAHDGVQL